MKKTIISSIAALGCFIPAAATDIVDNVGIEDFQIERNGDFLILDMDMGLRNLKVASNQCVLLTPRIVNGSDSISLPSVAIYGRSRYYYYKRNYGEEMMSGKDEIRFMAADKPDTIEYHQLFDFCDWMDGAKITLERTDRGCCADVLLKQYGEIGLHHEKFFPELVYIQPKADREKRRTLEGQAFIDFPVDETIIYPDYRNNTVELAKILATIDTIRDDNDARIDTVWLKGYASPESPYKHNTELAIGRTAALKRHIEQLYHFDNVAMLTDYEPEDWAGLRKFVESTNLDHRAEILDLIDSSMDPDAKEAKIKKLYPADYKFMLQNFYPALRHTDYRITYVIRTYSDPAEILAVMQKNPGKLDQREFYIAASEFEPGSDEFADVFETAVRMFPSDETANLNAANAAIRRDDFASAHKYLDKAGNSPEALYARGALAVREKDYAAARKYLDQASKAGLHQADASLEELNKRHK